MVDNKNNQWEDMEYTEDNTENNEALEYDDDNSYNEQGDEQEYEEYDEEGYDESEEDYDDNYAPKKKSPLPLIIIFLILLLAAGFFAVPKLMGSKENVDVANSNTNQEQMFEDNNNNNSESMLPVGDGQNQDPFQDQNQMGNQDQFQDQSQNQNQNQDDLANSFFDAAGGNNNDMVSFSFNENNQKNNNVNGDDLFASRDDMNSGNDSIMVAYNRAARLNPFKPPVVTKSSRDIPYETYNNAQFEIIEPPTSSIEDENLTKLLQTQISGILYDKESPSAIVNLNGQDSFVKIGDVISGYKIEDITRDKVQISYKDNSYVASVGELFTKGYLDKQQAVVNLENKFAGRYKNKQ